MAISKDAWISEYRQNVTKFLASMNQLLASRAQYDALTYGSTLVDEDFVGSNAGITAVEMKAAVASAATIGGAFQGTAHETNLYKIKA